ncbi:hypothetical protein PAPHI01_2033 [Pancytospora philotis]|nr:hypothetical protein PAPHI01_2033 [Pancytospora philotis]
MTTVQLPSGRSVQALIDTGADISCVLKQLLPSSVLKPSRLESIRTIDTSGASGLRTSLLPLRILDTVIEVELLAFESLAYEMVLGLDTISQLIPVVGLKRIFAHEEPPIQVCSVLEDFSIVMKDEVLATTPAKLPSFAINTAEHAPIATSRYHLGKPADDQVELEVNKLLRLGIVRKSFSPWCSPALLVPKHDGTQRLCIDYRKINDITVKDAFPLPRIDDILDTLSGACIFSTLDATSGYHQIPISEGSISKTAFQTRSGLYEYTRMPFGLSNAPAAFQRAMNELFADEKEKFLQVYLDDIIIYSKSREEHELHLKRVLDKIKAANLILKRKKCKFYRDELTVLGYVVRQNEVRPSPERVQGIRDFPVPTTVTELRSFHGLLTYCSNFIEDLAIKSAPLTSLLKGSPAPGTKITLSEAQLAVFNELKALLTSDAALALPDYDKPFIVTTDASTHGISGILAQKSSGGKECPVSFFSKKTSDAQSRYSATQLELLAVVETLRHYRHYLIHKPFVLRTDHQALLALKHTTDQNSMLFRWSLFLSDFSFDVEYIKGESNPADALSRADHKTVCSLQTSHKQIVLDPDIQRLLIQGYHDALGHGSASNMIYNLKRKYDWKGLYTQVHDMVKECQICLRASRAVSNTNYHMLTSTGPGELIEIDTVGPFPCSFSGKKFILLAIDHFTKFVCGMAVPHKSAEHVANFITDVVSPTFPSAKVVLSDNGLEFRGSASVQAAQRLGITWKFGSPYHPETQGAIERVNDTILCKLRKLCNFSHNLWDRALPGAIAAYNMSFHRAIGCSPHELLKGQCVLLDSDRGLLPQDFDLSVPENQLLAKRSSLLDKYQREFSGSTTATSNFSVGDFVLKYNFSPALSKIDPHWDPGFRIKLIKPGSEAFIVEKGGVEYSANKAHLRLDTSVVPQEGGSNVATSL